MNGYIGNNNIAQKIKNIYIGVNGTARQVQKGYIRVDGVAKQFYQKMTIISAPSLSGSYTYNGSAQTPTFTNYNSSTMTIGGTYSATNAGTYTATFTPKTGYCWSDESTGSKSISWSIAKASGYITLSATSGTVNKNSSITFTVNSYSGSLSVSSSNTSNATCSISGTTVTVTGKTGGGSATITVSVAASTNYNATSATYSVSVNYIWNKYNCNSTASGYGSSTASQYVYTSDNFGLWINLPYPLSSEGTVVSYVGGSPSYSLNSSNGLFTISGTVNCAKNQSKPTMNASFMAYYPDRGNCMFVMSSTYTGSVVYNMFAHGDSEYQESAYICFNWDAGSGWRARSGNYNSPLISPILIYRTTSYVSSYTYSKGSTSYGTVASSSSSAYPSNGKSGDYWYVSA